MSKANIILGIDIGSVTIGMVLLDSDGRITDHGYEFHHGDIHAKLSEMINKMNVSTFSGVAVTDSTPETIFAHRRYDDRLAAIEAAGRCFERVGSILMVGGEHFGLIRFDSRGKYAGYETNTSCAAGTGGFLDQQASRLQLGEVSQLAKIARENENEIPKIATRCAVFAKTDLVHAQQEGYSMGEICEGLCRGLAKNIVDTVFSRGLVREPVVCCGGVSLNRSVMEHIGKLLNTNITISEYSHLFGAWGAALLLNSETGNVHRKIIGVNDLFLPETRQRSYYYPPLELKLSGYPDFDAHEHYLDNPFGKQDFDSVEVDVYENLEPGHNIPVYLGIDIGSTSTKAVLTGTDGKVYAGFYCRTAGAPLKAVQKLMASMANMAKLRQIEWVFKGAGTTGSGRKFIAKIIGADLVIDEISAHARAAVEIDPKVDTIIEIGGQDSKFTTLENGRVTFSVMNTVCAAGTGSFIEEQAKKLGCPLSEYADRAKNRPAPISSNRCTVFMERDLNQLLIAGYSTEEVFAAVLHSVRENYLSNVATENYIGKKIFFQGATAKNKTLAAAFEQRLQKPVHVSPYCHLTGALGAALSLSEMNRNSTRFRGIGIFRKQVPLEYEICPICTNHCKLTVAEIDGERVAYGFLCGRDYDTKKFVDNNRSGFDLFKTRKRKCKAVTKHYPQQPVIGIPRALYLLEDVPFWRHFFNTLGFNTEVSEDVKDALHVGRGLSGAEFCAPLTALYGHVDRLLEEKKGQPDRVFLPVYLEHPTDNRDDCLNYCYYSQFAPALVANAMEGEKDDRLLTPLVYYRYHSLKTKANLYKALNKIPGHKTSFLEISNAWDQALTFKQESIKRLQSVYREQTDGEDNIHAMLLGRPYIVLSAAMNKHIPDLFASMGIKTFYQDMIEISDTAEQTLQSILYEIPWHYASKILEAAAETIRKPGAYPVLLTSFRCSPDSFLVDYFKKLMAAHNKPYLILQLDEHDSSVGYETRIEAAVRAFRNHYEHAASTSGKKAKLHCPEGLISRKLDTLGDRTLLLPNWDDYSMKLVASNLIRRGIDARLLEESEPVIRKSLNTNSGQCIPLNILAAEIIEYIQKHDLDPAKTAFWTINSKLACNLRMFPHHIRTLLLAHGKGMEKVGIYTGTLSFIDFSYALPVNTYFGFMFGGMLRRMACRIRPYERIPGVADQVVQKSLHRLQKAFLNQTDKEEALSEIVNWFSAIPVSDDFYKRNRPKVAIFGDLYARDNDVMNQDLIRFIEKHGGEVITTPYSEYLKMVSEQYMKKWFREGDYFNVVSSTAYLMAVKMKEKRYMHHFEKIIGETEPDFNDSVEERLRQYNLLVEHTGESMDNILKIGHILTHHPDVSLFVQTSPAFCCPSMVTEAMGKKIEQLTGVPLVSLTYDGTFGRVNEAVIPYLAFAKKPDKGKNTPETDANRRLQSG